MFSGQLKKPARGIQSGRVCLARPAHGRAGGRWAIRNQVLTGTVPFGSVWQAPLLLRRFQSVIHVIEHRASKIDDEVGFRLLQQSVIRVGHTSVVAHGIQRIEAS